MGPGLSGWRRGIAARAVLVMAVLVVLAISAGSQDEARVPTYTEFLQQVDRGQVRRVTLNTKDNSIDVELGLDLIRLRLRELLLDIGELPFGLIQRRLEIRGGSRCAEVWFAVHHFSSASVSAALNILEECLPASAS